MWDEGGVGGEGRGQRRGEGEGVAERDRQKRERMRGRWCVRCVMREGWKEGLEDRGEG